MIKKLSECYAPSGREEQVRNIIRNELNDFYSDIIVDDLGNMIVHKEGSVKKIAITAPMDEVGFLITNVADGGRVNTASIGCVKSNTLHGITAIDGHNNYFTNLSYANFVEINGKIKNFELLKYGECKGNELNTDLLSNTLVFDTKYKEVCGYAIGKALERSVCCKILCDIARTVSDSMYEYFFVFTAQNYCDQKGSQTALYNKNIDELYNICAVEAEDNIVPGKGPVAVLRDKNFISSESAVTVFNKFDKVQKLVSDKILCEAGCFQRNTGVSAVSAVAVPAYNLHSPNESVFLEDAKLLTNMITEIVLP